MSVGGDVNITRLSLKSDFCLGTLKGLWMLWANHVFGWIPEAKILDVGSLYIYLPKVDI